MTNTKRTALVVAFCLIGLTVPGHGSAASSAQPTGVSLSPFEQQIAIRPTDAAKSFSLTLTNHTKSLQELDLTARDFGSLNDTGGILLEGSNSYTQHYGLTSWLALDTDTVVLRAGESKSITVTIDNRNSLLPGGHYGAVVASINSLNDQSGNHVVINQQLLSLILVDKVGGEHYGLKLAAVSYNGNWISLPNTVRLHFQNPGNVHVIPRGLVELVSPTGAVIAKGVINDGSAFILPESFRDIFVSLSPVSRNLPLPGTYHLEVLYRYDGINRYAAKSYALRFISLQLYVAIALIILLVWYGRRRRKVVQKKRA